MELGHSIIGASNLIRTIEESFETKESSPTSLESAFPNCHTAFDIGYRCLPLRDLIDPPNLFDFYKTLTLSP